MKIINQKILKYALMIIVYIILSYLISEVLFNLIEGKKIVFDFSGKQILKYSISTIIFAGIIIPYLEKRERKMKK